MVLERATNDFNQLKYLLSRSGGASMASSVFQVRGGGGRNKGMGERVGGI